MMAVPMRGCHVMRLPSLGGGVPRHEMPKFVMQPVAGPVARPDAGTTRLSVVVCAIACRVDKVVRARGSATPGACWLRVRAVVKATSLQSHAVRAFGADLAHPLTVAVASLRRSAASAAPAVLRTLAAALRHKAHSMEQKFANETASAWRRWLLGESQPMAGPCRLPRQAFRWIRGPGGWSRSAVGHLDADAGDAPAEAGDEPGLVHEEDDLLEGGSQGCDAADDSLMHTVALAHMARVSADGGRRLGLPVGGRLPLHRALLR